MEAEIEHRQAAKLAKAMHLNEEEEKAVLDTSVKKLEQSALAGDAEDLIKKADRKLRKAAEEKLPVDPEVVAEKAE